MEKKIIITKNGPYKVEGGTPLKQAVIFLGENDCSERWEEGKAYPQEEAPYYLCRCGHSSEKPFCDATHLDVEFDGAETALPGIDRENAVKYEGATIDMIDDENLCASLRFCDRDPGAWVAAAESDIDGYEQTAIEETCACASGRLTVLRKDGTPVEPELPQEISPIQDTAAGCRGPLWVKGGIALMGAEGMAYDARNRMTLCRCGESDNLPFCNTSHLSCPHMKGFDD